MNLGANFHGYSSATREMTERVTTLDPRLPQQPHPCPPPAAVWVGIGARLRQARRIRGVERDEAAAVLGASVAELAAIEAGRPERYLGDLTALLLRVHRYAAWLGLDADALVGDVLRVWEEPLSGRGRAEAGATRARAAGSAPRWDDEPTRFFPAAPAAPERPVVHDADDDGDPTGPLPLFAAGPPTRATIDAGTGSTTRTGHARRPRAGTAGAARAPRPLRRLRTAVVATGVAVVLAAGGVVAAEAGVLPGHPTIAPAAAAGTIAQAAPGPADLLAPGASGAGSATYTLPAGDFTVEVRDPSRGCWVRISGDGGGGFAGVLPAGQTARVPAHHGATVELGAGGATVTVRQGHRSQQLTPDSAPYALTFRGS